MMGFVAGFLLLLCIELIVSYQAKCKECKELKSKLEAGSPAGEFKELVQEQEEELGFGTYVRWGRTNQPTANTYRLLFDIDPNGQKIIDDLTMRFKRSVFASNDAGGERETARRIGRQEVVDFILNRINTANDPRYSEQLELMEQENHDL